MQEKAHLDHWPVRETSAENITPPILHMQKPWPVLRWLIRSQRQLDSNTTIGGKPPPQLHTSTTGLWFPPTLQEMLRSTPSTSCGQQLHPFFQPSSGRIPWQEISLRPGVTWWCCDSVPLIMPNIPNAMELIRQWLNQVFLFLSFFFLPSIT